MPEAASRTRSIKLTVTLTVTGYRRIAPNISKMRSFALHPTALRLNNRTTNQKVAGSSPTERAPKNPANRNPNTETDTP